MNPSEFVVFIGLFKLKLYQKSETIIFFSIFYDCCQLYEEARDY